MENYILWKVAMLEINYQRILKILLHTILVEFLKILKSSDQNSESLLFRMWAIGPPRKWWRRWVVYMCFNFLQLAPSIMWFILSWGEKNCYIKRSKIKNCPGWTKLSFYEFAQLYTTVIIFSAWDLLSDPGANVN